MKVLVLAIGRLKEAHFKAAEAEYLKRLERYAAVTLREVKDEPALLKALPEKHKLILLDERGQNRSSEELARSLGEEAQHGGGRTVVFALGGSRVVIGASDRIARVWDPQANRITAEFTRHSEQVLCLAVSPDGALVASGSLDRSIRLWRAEDGRPVRVIGEHSGGVLSLAFAGGGEQVVSSSYDGTVRLWALARGAELRRYNAGSGAGTAVAVTPGDQGEQLLAGSSDATMLRWNLDSLASLRRWITENRYVPLLTREERLEQLQEGP